MTKPPFLVTDNGSSFLAKRFCAHVRDLYTHVRIRYRTPTQLGLLERFHRTFKDEEVYWRLYDTPAHARDCIAEFRSRYNESRPHWALVPGNGGDPLTHVVVTRLTDGLCGPHRPGHFDGVTTVVAILFNIVQPDVAYFGQKDAQQAVVIRKMAEDLHFPVAVAVCPTVRDADGLAVSSRNVYLSAAERTRALSLGQALRLAEARIEAGERDAAALTAAMRRHIKAAGPCTIDYVEIVDAETLAARGLTAPEYQSAHRTPLSPALSAQVGFVSVIIVSGLFALGLPLVLL